MQYGAKTRAAELIDRLFPEYKDTVLNFNMKEKMHLYLPDKSLCGDNAAMIASQGYYEFLAGNTAGMDLNACAQRSIE